MRSFRRALAVFTYLSRARCHAAPVTLFAAVAVWTPIVGCAAQRGEPGDE
jgi:hypothetical protein